MVILENKCQNGCLCVTDCRQKYRKTLIMSQFSVKEILCTKWNLQMWHGHTKSN